MSNTSNKPPSKSGPRKETGMMTERVELKGPRAEQEPLNPTVSEEETFMPHERDQTTKPTGTSQPNENLMSQSVIGQAAEDMEHGLKDTDRRGIPSDIVKSDVPASERGSDVPEKARKKEK